MNNLGKVLVLVGIILAVIGGLLILGERFGLGKLPGDILLKKGNVTFYFPLVSGIIISLVLSLLLNIIFRRR
ncbi:DUF2905 domain-containing protein [Alkaliphilus peptidifermentans]|uniref:DUF2905 domain-containing protein n=1 Tax=Alkaliphilus peptidifermentans DSM 18978 TaxID=1120976 RepID=A0A1G5L598_9FIRM|nr:DUF2905 domain-containing protein [Alkaliphilus peptidifermentans]SCZ07369.1 Protein of unknown function [Alkaliphilus peptidifermentans DSM 18978]